jgi:peptide deformylase
MIREVILYPDPSLEMPCDPVKEFNTPALQQLLADMFETMYFNGGLGLAAPQIGVMKQVAVIDPSSGKDPGKKIVLINSRITDAQGVQHIEEGCLSFPGMIEKVTRSMSVSVCGMDITGAATYLQTDGLVSCALQHEIDHLNGILFIKRMSSLKRELICRKVRKLLRAGKWGPTQGSVESK